MTDTLPIYEQTLTARYHHPDATQRHPTPSGGTPVSLDTFEQDIRQHFEAFTARAKADVTAGEEWLASKLPEVAELVHQAQGNELVQAGLAAVHVPPSVLSGFAAAVNALEAELAKATGQTINERRASESLPPAELAGRVPELPDFEQPPPLPAPQAGPVVGGQAR